MTKAWALTNTDGSFVVVEGRLFIYEEEEEAKHLAKEYGYKATPIAFSKLEERRKPSKKFPPCTKLPRKSA